MKLVTISIIGCSNREGPHYSVGASAFSKRLLRQPPFAQVEVSVKASLLIFDMTCTVLNLAYINEGGRCKTSNVRGNEKAVSKV